MYKCTCTHMLINVDMHTPTRTYTLMLVNGCLCLQGFLEWKAVVGTYESGAVGSNGSEVWQELWIPFWGRYERVVRGILEFPSWSLDKGTSPGSSPTEDSPGPLCAVPGGCHFPLQEEGAHSVV